MPRKNILTLIISLAVFGLGVFGFSAKAKAAINGVLHVHPENPRYFTDDSGDPIYLAGWNVWSNVVDGIHGTGARPGGWNYRWEVGDGKFDFAAALDDMEENNLNYIRLWANNAFKVNYDYNGVGGRPESDFPTPLPWVATGPGTGTNNHLKYDLTVFNPEYFQRLKDRIYAAQERGIYVSVMMFDGWSNADGYNLQGFDMTMDHVTWRYNPFFYNNNINGVPNIGDSGEGGRNTFTLVYPLITELQELYIKEVIDAVNEFDNVIYEVCNECPEDSYGGAPNGGSPKAWEIHMINYIQEYERDFKAKQHPVGITSNTRWQHEQDVLDNNVNSSEFVSWRRDTPGIAPPFSDYTYWENPPKSNGEKVIIQETDHMNADYYRTNVAKSVGWPWKMLTRGLNPSMLRRSPSGQGRDVSGHDAGVRSMGDTVVYANSKINLASMIPVDDSSCSSTTYCLADPGEEYLVYQPDSGPFTVNLPAGDYNYEWFDPMNGLVGEIDTVTASGGNHTFPNPVNRQVVLYLKAVADFVPADINNDTKVNIKDIQICIKAITNPGSIPTEHLQRCKELSAPNTVANIKDIQVIIREIINPS